MSNLQIPPGDDPAEQAEVLRHTWSLQADPASNGHLWSCACNYVIFQPGGAPAPDELIGHPQSFGQMRGDK
jgi:hypothetical protein